MPYGNPNAATSEAYLLAWVGGCIDAVGLLTLSGLFVSHMSGNTASLGAFIGQGEWSLGWPHLGAVPLFVIGSFLGYLCIATTGSFRRCALILLVEAGLLTLFAAGLYFFGGEGHSAGRYFLLAIPALLAMGLQNATLRQVGRTVFASTYVTGVLDMLARSAAECWKMRGTPDAKIRLTHAVSAAGVWLCYAAGALCGGAGLMFARLGILIVPIVILLALAWRFFQEEAKA